MRKFIILLLVGVLCFCGYKMFPNVKSLFETKESLRVVDKIVKETTTGDELFSQDAWLKLKSENDDYVGQLIFDSEIISLPVVQSGDNDYYLRKSFSKEYNEEGIPFMDYACSLNSTNITIYGHNVYYDDTAMFSPLSFFVNQEKLNGNETFYLYLENEVRMYQITDVYYIDVSGETPTHNYLQADFSDKEEFDEWYQYAHLRNLIQSDKKIEYGDRMITLQTCKRYDSNTRILVLAKQLSTAKY